MTKIGLYGGGRMSRAVTRLAQKRDNIDIRAIVSRTTPDWIGGIPHYHSLQELDQDIDVLVDFTLPDAVASAASWCVETGTPLLSGITGLGVDGHRILEEAATSVPVLHSVNFSTGISVVRLLSEALAGIIGESAEVDIEDIHHRRKKDAPSGTAIMLGKAIASSRDQDFDEVAQLAPASGKPRKKGDIVFSSIRAGSEIGHHRIRFTLAGEHIEISHQAGRRTIYADGALRAAAWLASQPPGFYSTRDFLTSIASAK